MFGNMAFVVRIHTTNDGLLYAVSHIRLTLTKTSQQSHRPLVAVPVARQLSNADNNIKVSHPTIIAITQHSQPRPLNQARINIEARYRI